MSKAQGQEVEILYANIKMFLWNESGVCDWPLPADQHDHQEKANHGDSCGKDEKRSYVRVGDFLKRVTVIRNEHNLRASETAPI